MLETQHLDLMQEQLKRYDEKEKQKRKKLYEKKLRN